MIMKSALLPIAALFAIGIAGNSIVYAEEVAKVATADSHGEQSSTEEIKVVALTDPEIAAAEDEEPDCE